MVSTSSTPWGRVREISVTEIPAVTHRPAAVWEALGWELALRLECTPRKFALEVSFEDAYAAQCAYAALCKFFPKHVGKGAVKITRRSGGPVLFIRRGKNWVTHRVL